MTTSPPLDVVALTQALLRADSVTPARGTVFDVLEAALSAIGFAVDRFTVGEAPDGPVENLLATRGQDSATGGRHLAFAGHVDVVPPGEGWTTSPWSGTERGGLLYGRGAVDMKGAVAAFIAAAAVETGGALSLIITGDEEGPATYGTVALIERMAARGIAPDWCLVGEPTSTRHLGDMMKIGRRGSVRNASPDTRPVTIASGAWPCATARIRSISAAPDCSSLKRIDSRASALAGMTLCAGLPTAMSVTSMFDGWNQRLPVSSTIASTSARIATSLGIGLSARCG